MDPLDRNRRAPEQRACGLLARRKSQRLGQRQAIVQAGLLWLSSVRRPVGLDLHLRFAGLLASTGQARRTRDEFDLSAMQIESTRVGNARPSRQAETLAIGGQDADIIQRPLEPTGEIVQRKRLLAALLRGDIEGERGRHAKPGAQAVGENDIARRRRAKPGLRGNQDRIRGHQLAGENRPARGCHPHLAPDMRA